MFISCSWKLKWQRNIIFLKAKAYGFDAKEEPFLQNKHTQNVNNKITCICSFLNPVREERLRNILFSICYVGVSPFFFSQYKYFQVFFFSFICLHEKFHLIEKVPLALALKVR